MRESCAPGETFPSGRAVVRKEVGRTSVRSGDWEVGLRAVWTGTLGVARAAVAKPQHSRLMGRMPDADTSAQTD